LSPPSGSPSRPTTMPRRPGRLGHPEGRPIRTHSPWTVTRVPARTGLGMVSSRTTRRLTVQWCTLPTDRIETPSRVSRVATPGTELSPATPWARTPSPDPRSPTHDAPARLAAEAPRRMPAPRPEASAR
jgi:hypothetical protein